MQAFTVAAHPLPGVMRAARGRLKGAEIGRRSLVAAVVYVELLQLLSSNAMLREPATNNRDDYHMYVLHRGAGEMEVVCQQSIRTNTKIIAR